MNSLRNVVIILKAITTELKTNLKQIVQGFFATIKSEILNQYYDVILGKVSLKEIITKIAIEFKGRMQLTFQNGFKALKATMPANLFFKLEKVIFCLGQDI